MATQTGVDIICMACRSCDLAPLAGAVGITAQTLDEFTHGRTRLGPDVLKALAQNIWHGTLEYDVHLNALCIVKQAPPKAHTKGTTND